MGSLSSKLPFSPPPYWRDYGIVGDEDGGEANSLSFRADQSTSNISPLFTESTPKQMRQVIKDSGEILTLETGWDGYEGKPISQDAMRFMWHILEAVFSENPRHLRVDLVPLSYGGIQAEWHTWNADFEIEVEGVRRFRWYFKNRKTGEEEEGEGREDFSPVQDFYGRL